MSLCRRGALRNNAPAGGFALTTPGSRGASRYQNSTTATPAVAGRSATTTTTGSQGTARAADPPGSTTADADRDSSVPNVAFASQTDPPDSADTTAYEFSDMNTQLNEVRSEFKDLRILVVSIDERIVEFEKYTDESLATVYAWSKKKHDQLKVQLSTIDRTNMNYLDINASNGDLLKQLKDQGERQDELQSRLLVCLMQINACGQGNLMEVRTMMPGSKGNWTPWATTSIPPVPQPKFWLASSHCVVSTR